MMVESWGGPNYPKFKKKKKRKENKSKHTVVSDACISIMGRKSKSVCKKPVSMEQEQGGGGGRGAKWVTHYSSDHQILLVGDGDFSFSLCLARSFGSAANIVASSLDFYGLSFFPSLSFSPWPFTVVIVFLHFAACFSVKVSTFDTWGRIEGTCIIMTLLLGLVKDVPFTLWKCY